MHPVLRALGLGLLVLACVAAASFGGCYIGDVIAPPGIPMADIAYMLGGAVCGAVLGLIGGALIVASVIRRDRTWRVTPPPGNEPGPPQSSSPGS